MAAAVAMAMATRTMMMGWGGGGRKWEDLGEYDEGDGVDDGGDFDSN